MTDYVFTAASLTGTYAVAMEGEGGYAPYAAFGLIRFYGIGAVSGYFSESRVVRPSASGSL